MNSAAVVFSPSWVRRAWRQFQRRQVTPASSHHTDLARFRVFDHRGAAGGRIEGLRAGSADQPGRTAVAVSVLPPSGIWWSTETAL